MFSKNVIRMQIPFNLDPNCFAAFYFISINFLKGLIIFFLFPFLCSRVMVFSI